MTGLLQVYFAGRTWDVIGESKRRYVITGVFPTFVPDNMDDTEAAMTGSVPGRVEDMRSTRKVLKRRTIPIAERTSP